MKNMTSSTGRVAAVIGDLVGSRQQPSRSDVQAALAAALQQANDVVPARQALEATIGDEFQGAYDTVGAACLAVLLVRLALPPALDSRAGIGVGTIEIVGESRYGLTQDGPAWWSARAAIVEVKDGERRVPGLRTQVATGQEQGQGEQMGWVNAYLTSRDAIVTRFDARQRRLALGLLTGRTRAQLAESEGISASAVSQSLRRSGASALVESVRVLQP